LKPFPNPEDEWERAAATTVLDPSDVERRLGHTNEPLEVLRGGHANVNVRVGSGRVLRIYRRDPGTGGKEMALLQLPWASFVVPSVLGSGEDFLVLDYIPHGPLGVDREHGTRIGRALAEIHRMRFTQSGFLGADLQVCTPFTDTLEALRSYARSELDRAALPAGSDLRSLVLACLANRLDALRAAAESPVLLHGDFKASNLHWTSDDRLLVLDWEFAYSGPALMDVGQLLRWDPPATFISAFAESYRAEGGELPDGWQRSAEVFDLFNLVGLLAGAAPDSRRSLDVRRRMRQTVERR
jgi:fructosamine-3-kinase